MRKRKRSGRDEPVVVPPEFRAKVRELVAHCGGNQSQVVRELRVRARARDVTSSITQRQFHRLLTRPRVAWKTLELVARHGPELMGEGRSETWLRVAMSPRGARALERYGRAVAATEGAEGIVYAAGDRAIDPNIDAVADIVSGRFGTTSHMTKHDVADRLGALFDPVAKWSDRMLHRGHNPERITLAVDRILLPLIWGESPVGLGIELSLAELRARRSGRYSALEELIRLGLRREAILLDRDTDQVRAQKAYVGNAPPSAPAEKRARRTKGEVRAARLAKKAAPPRASRRARGYLTREERAARAAWQHLRNPTRRAAEDVEDGDD